MNADAALFQLLGRQQKQPFEWGVHDCVTFVCDALLALTGRDPGADLRGTYATWPQAEARLRQLGGLCGLASERFGARLEAGEPLRCGDVVLLERQTCEGALSELGAFGVVWRGGVLAQGAEGPVWVKGLPHRKAWRPVLGGDA